MQAAQAAAATPPIQSESRRSGPAEPASRSPEHAATRAQGAAARVVRTGEGLAQGTRRFGESAWRPFVRLSGVLWLELTGVFFGLFLLTASIDAWRLRATALHRAADRAGFHHLLWSLGMAAVFGYFSVSSFVRARRRERAPRNP